jgi:hypothetical protein
MNSESKPDPKGENSRRDFLQKIGTAAAASTVAANASAQQPPAPSTRPGRGFVPIEPGPLSKQPMPTIRLGKHNVGRLILGINGIGSHFSEVVSRDFRVWNTPERQVQVLKHCEELGINLRVQTRDQINKYNAEHGGKMLFSSSMEYPLGSTGDMVKTVKAMAALGPITIHLDAGGEGSLDGMWRRGELNKVREWAKIVKDTGVMVALSGHVPEAFAQVESEGWDVDYYMTGLYQYGRTREDWEKLYAATPGLAPIEVGEPPSEDETPHYGGQAAWVRGDPPEMLKVVKQIKRPCLVFKIFASGNLMANARPQQQQEIVEARFKYVLENIKSTDGVVAAMWNKYEDQYALNKQYVVKYGGLSIRT